MLALLLISSLYATSAPLNYHRRADSLGLSSNSDSVNARILRDSSLRTSKWIQQALSRRLLKALVERRESFLESNFKEEKVLEGIQDLWPRRSYDVVTLQAQADLGSWRGWVRDYHAVKTRLIASNASVQLRFPWMELIGMEYYRDEGCELN